MPEPIRYALVVNGEIVHGPGPLPYIWPHPETGDPIELSALTDAERTALGWLQVEQRNWREIDDEIVARSKPNVFFDRSKGRPVEEHVYGFNPGAREIMLRRVDEQAEARRRQYITPGDGQTMEYEEAYRQALAVLALPEDEPILNGTYPFLDADIGVTLNPLTGRLVMTVREAAQVVKFMRDQWEQVGAAIRKTRLAAKASIRRADTDAEAYNIFLNINWPA